MRGEADHALAQRMRNAIREQARRGFNRIVRSNRHHASSPRRICRRNQPNVTSTPGPVDDLCRPLFDELVNPLPSHGFEQLE